MKCIQTDSAYVPIAGNSLTGQAHLETLATGEVSQYSGVAIPGKQNLLPTCTGNAAMVCNTDLDCAGSGTCAFQLTLDDVVYDACPQSLIVSHYANGAADDAGAIVTGEFTLVPCTEDFFFQTNATVTAAFHVPSTQGTASVPFSCWVNLGLDDAVFGGMYNVPGPLLPTQIDTLSQANAGFIGVFEEFHTQGSLTGPKAINVQRQGTRGALGDVITLPLPLSP